MKEAVLSNAAIAFEPAKVVSEYQEQINRLKEQNDELAKDLGKTTIERGSHLHFADVGIKCYTFNKSSDDFIMNIQ
ncbi:hypothetical protein [Rickettsia endosymbiont of Cantharis rufa]|uniref:hypothetical protein n=1 Tax=Rickettsia endosymbiont of Cantharis rufa TaxID=3066248 RepID=UPI00313299D5